MKKGRILLITPNLKGISDGVNRIQPFEMFEKIIYVDSLMLSRYIHHNRRYHSMKDLCGLYNVTNKSAHRAMGDVDALVEIWTHLITHFKQNHADCSGTHLKYILYL